MTTLRLAGADESYLLSADLFGLGAPIQFSWVFGADTDPGADAVTELRLALARGPLNRAVARTRVPAARDRWVRSAVSVIPTRTEHIGDDEVSDWLDRRLRTARLDPAEGSAWRLDDAVTGDGRRVVSLLVSHMVTDGQGVYRALDAAASGSAADLPPDGSAHGARAVRDDLTDAARQLGAAARAVRIVAAEATRGLSQRTEAPPTPVRPVPPDTAHRPGTGDCPDTDDCPDTTLAIVDVDRETWHRRAQTHGGTANSLFVAVLAGIVARAGVPVGEGADALTKVCIAVSRRGDESDDRANASGGVWIRVPGEVEPRMDLSVIRSQSKKAFVEYAESGADRTADNLQAIVRLLPGTLIGKMMRAIPGPDTTVSNLGVAPETALAIGGSVAERFSIRAIMLGVPPSARRKQGPAIAAWAVEYHDRITLTFFGINPDHFGDPELLHKLISTELVAWGVPGRLW